MKRTKPLTKGQRKKAVQAVQRTLDGIDFEKFWERVLTNVAPLVRANELVRARSLSKAATHVLY